MCLFRQSTFGVAGAECAKLGKVVLLQEKEGAMLCNPNPEKLHISPAEVVLYSYRLQITFITWINALDEAFVILLYCWKINSV